VNRKALLIAIADYRYLPKLGYVANDIQTLLPALLRAGFSEHDITEMGAGTDKAGEISSTDLKRAIGRFLASASRDDDLLILFSGHGVEIEGRRVLMPQGYDRDYPESLENLLWDGEIAATCRSSKAHSVVVAIDACRTDAVIKLAPAPKGSSSEGPADRPLVGDFAGPGTDMPTLAFCYSCGPGERSGADRDGASSAFTRAFADVLGDEAGPSELLPFAKAVAERAERVAARNQTATCQGQEGRAGPWQQLVLKEDAAARFRQRVRESKWCARLAEKQLFAIAKEIPGFGIQVQSIAVEAEARVQEAARLLSGQRWRDEFAWTRLLDHVWNVFLGPNADKNKINPAEAALLIAVPLVYETAIAAAEAQLAQIGPVLDPISYIEHKDSSLWRQWRNAFAAAEETDTQRARLLERGLAEVAEDVAAWRLNDFCHRAGELWDLTGGRDQRSGWAREAIQAILAEAPVLEVQKDSRVREVLSPERLLRLARLMFASLEDVIIAADAGDGTLDRRATFGAFPAQIVIDEVRSAHLLNLAAQMTLDVRRLSPLLSEHLGTDDKLGATWLKDRIAEAVWQQVASGRFTVQLECPNEALDAALLAAIDGLESYRGGLARRTDEAAACVTDLLPTAFLSERLNSNAIRSGALRRPPLRFELDRARIINLLMGREFYGDTAPALRELYQNALDACRYRRSQELLQGREYNGRIEFRFGATEGRQYLECVDNGIGMADRHIRQLFALPADVSWIVTSSTSTAHAGRAQEYRSFPIAALGSASSATSC
jgi:hypothetical protein